jgi:putative ABC transport system permease protein
MAITLVQRRREIGTLQALGTTRFQLVQLFTLEGMLIGLVGSVVGIAIGVGMSKILLELTGRAISKAYISQALTDTQIRWQVLASSFGLGVFTTTLSSAIPAFAAAKNRVSETLRSGTVVSLTVKRGLGKADAFGLLLMVGAYFAMRIPPRNNHPVGAFAAVALLLVAGRMFLPRVIQLVHFVLAPLARLFGLHARLANDNLQRDIGRTAATSTALMAGAALTVGFAAFNVGFVGSMEQWSAQSVPGDLFVTSGASLSGGSSRNIPMAPDLGFELEKLPGVEAVQRVRLADYDYHGFPVKLISSELDVEAKYVTRTYLEGTAEDGLRGQREGRVLVSENFAHRFKVHKGDVLQLSVKDGTAPFEVGGVVLDYSSDIGCIRFDRKIYQKYWGDDRVDTFELNLSKDSDVEAMRRTVNERFGQKFNLFILTNKEYRSEMLDTADSVFALMRVLEFVLLVVAVLGIINSLLANVLDRIREIGVLRALGMLRHQVSRMIIMEATMTGLVGIVAGSLTGIAMGYVIVTYVTSLQTGWFFAYQPPVRRMLEIAAIALPLAAVAGWYPARQAASLVVRDALDYE